MRYIELKGDLFSVNNSFALAHCISRDCEMGKGIALLFNRKYPEMKETLLRQNPQMGEAKVHYSKERIIFNLITKEKYSHKPTYDSFIVAIHALKREMIAHNVKRLAIPLLGAGLDKLNWDVNKYIIKAAFMDTDIDVLVCIKEN